VGGERRGNVVVWRSSCRENKEKKKKQKKIGNKGPKKKKRWGRKEEWELLPQSLFPKRY